MKKSALFCSLTVVSLVSLVVVGESGCRRSPADHPAKNQTASPPPVAGSSQPTPEPRRELPPFAVDAVETREGTALWYDVPDRSLAARRAWPEEMTAASDVLPQNTYVRVTRLEGPAESKPVIVRVTDNGIHKPGTLIEVDREAAQTLGMVKAGTTRVRVDVLRLQNATTDKPVDKKDGPAAPKASELTKQPAADARQEKDAAEAKDPASTGPK